MTDTSKFPHRFEDLKEADYEVLRAKALDDQDCCAAFIELHYDDFEQEMNERGIYPDYYCDHEIDYLEDNSDFVEFAFNYFNSAKIEWRAG